MKYTLETKRLLLRPFKHDDAINVFHGWASDNEVTKYLTWNTHKSIEETQNIINMWVDQYQKDERINFAIVLKETNTLIGGIDVCGYIEGVPVIGYVLSRKYWNNGYMTEAFTKVIEFLTTLGHNLIYVDAHVENLRSNKVIKKCGGIYRDTIEQYLPLKEETVKINRYKIIK